MSGANNNIKISKGNATKRQRSCQGRGRNFQRRQDQRRPIHSLENTNLQEQRLFPSQQYADGQHHELETQQEYCVDDYLFDPAPIYCVTHETSKPKQSGTRQGGRYFVTLHVSAAGHKFCHAKFQMDSAATCNTISEHTVKQLFPTLHPTKSPYLLFPYGDSKPIKPLGQVDLVCERQNKYYLVTFQILPADVMENKPALLSGKDCERMGLIKVHADEVHSLKHQNSPPQSRVVNQNEDERPIKRVFLSKRPLEKSDITTHAENFSGIGCLKPPVSFTTRPEVTPVQMPIHRVPISKRAKEKVGIDQYVRAGILVKVNDPTPSCSNIFCRESPSRFRVCIDPSQTINKSIKRPIFQMPTLNEQLHKLDKAKCFSLIDIKDGFLHVPLDERSSLMTTMHTPSLWC